MVVSLIAAVSKNLVIGINNKLPWYLPADMEFFKKTTTGHCVIMGRKNYESLPPKFKPLPNRTNIVVTRNRDFKARGCPVVSSVENGIEFARKSGETEAFIIGGGEIYRHSLEKNLVDQMYITEIDASFDGDTYFPSVDFKKWKVASRIKGERDEKNKMDYVFCVYEKSDAGK